MFILYIHELFVFLRLYCHLCMHEDGEARRFSVAKARTRYTERHLPLLFAERFARADKKKIELSLQSQSEVVLFWRRKRTLFVPRPGLGRLASSSSFPSFLNNISQISLPSKSQAMLTPPDIIK